MNFKSSLSFLLRSIAGLFVLVIAVELFVRNFVHLSVESIGRAGFVEPDPNLIWKLKPSTAGPLKTNKFGFRGAEYNPDAEYPIVILGDSVSWGDGVAEQELLYSQLVGKQLSAELGKSVSVLNAAVPGYSTFQQAKLLELRGAEFRPKLIVLQFCLNDVVERFQTLASHGGAHVFLGIDTRSTVKGLHGSLLRNSSAYYALISFLQDKAREHQRYEVEALTREPLSDELEAAWASVRSEMLQISVWAQQRGIPLIGMVMPYAFQLESSEESPLPQRRFLRYAKELGFRPTLDVLPKFQMALKESPEPLFVDANHLSKRGHELTAKALVEVISRLEDGQ